MKNKYLVILIAVGLIILVGLGTFFFLGKKNTAVTVDQTPSEEVVSTMKPEEIGLSLTASSDNKKVIVEVTKTVGLSAIDYELSYTSKGDIPRGAIGQLDLKAGKTVTKEITLGTCSDVCHYDEGVSNIKIILRVTKSDGTTAQVEKSLELTE